MSRRINWAAWQPDPRDFYDYDYWRGHRVYRTMTARYRGTAPFFCAECHKVILPGVKYDAMGVSGAGVSGYIHPTRLHCDCRAEFIRKSNERTAATYGLLIIVCADCGIYLGHKDGEGVTGITGGVCDSCASTKYGLEVGADATA